MILRMRMLREVLMMDQKLILRTLRMRVMTLNLLKLLMNQKIIMRTVRKMKMNQKRITRTRS